MKKILLVLMILIWMSEESFAINSLWDFAQKLYYKWYLYEWTFNDLKTCNNIKNKKEQTSVEVLRSDCFQLELNNKYYYFICRNSTNCDKTKILSEVWYKEISIKEKLDSTINYQNNDKKYLSKIDTWKYKLLFSWTKEKILSIWDKVIKKYENENEVIQSIELWYLDYKMDLYIDKFKNDKSKEKLLEVVELLKDIFSAKKYEIDNDVNTKLWWSDVDTFLWDLFWNETINNSDWFDLEESKKYISDRMSKSQSFSEYIYNYKWFISWLNDLISELKDNNKNIISVNTDILDDSKVKTYSSEEMYSYCKSKIPKNSKWTWYMYASTWLKYQLLDFYKNIPIYWWSIKAYWAATCFFPSTKKYTKLQWPNIIEPNISNIFTVNEYNCDEWYYKYVLTWVDHPKAPRCFKLEDFYYKKYSLPEKDWLYYLAKESIDRNLLCRSLWYNFTIDYKVEKKHVSSVIKFSSSKEPINGYKISLPDMSAIDVISEITCWTPISLEEKDILDSTNNIKDIPKISSSNKKEYCPEWYVTKDSYGFLWWRKERIFIKEEYYSKPVKQECIPISESKYFVAKKIYNIDWTYSSTKYIDIHNCLKSYWGDSKKIEECKVWVVTDKWKALCTKNNKYVGTIFFNVTWYWGTWWLHKDVCSRVFWKGTYRVNSGVISNGKVEYRNVDNIKLWVVEISHTKSDKKDRKKEIDLWILNKSDCKTETCTLNHKIVEYKCLWNFVFIWWWENWINIWTIRLKFSYFRNIYNDLDLYRNNCLKAFWKTILESNKIEWVSSLGYYYVPSISWFKKTLKTWTSTYNSKAPWNCWICPDWYYKWNEYWYYCKVLDWYVWNFYHPTEEKWMNDWRAKCSHWSNNMSVKFTIKKKIEDTKKSWKWCFTCPYWTYKWNTAWIFCKVPSWYIWNFYHPTEKKWMNDWRAKCYHWATNQNVQWIINKK